MRNGSYIDDPEQRKSWVDPRESVDFGGKTELASQKYFAVYAIIRRKPLPPARTITAEYY